MSISAVCPECGQAFKVKDQYSGRRGKCPRCEHVFRMPGEKVPRRPTTGATPGAEATPFAFDALPGTPAPETPPIAPPADSGSGANPFAFDAPAPAPSSHGPKPSKKPSSSRNLPSLPPPNPFASDPASPPIAKEVPAGSSEKIKRKKKPAPPAPPAAPAGDNPFAFPAGHSADAVPPSGGMPKPKPKPSANAPTNVQETQLFPGAESPASSSVSPSPGTVAANQGEDDQGNPFTFAGATLPPVEAPRARQKTITPPQGAATLDEGGAFAFTGAAPSAHADQSGGAAPAESSLPAVDARDHYRQVPRHSGATRAQPAGLGRTGAAGSWMGLAKCCQWLQVSAALIGFAVLLWFVLLQVAPLSLDVATTIALGAGVAAYAVAIRGRMAAKGVPDSGVASAARVSLMLSFLTAGLLLIALVLDVLLLAEVAGPSTPTILAIAFLGSVVCGALAEIFFARGLIRLALVMRYPTLQGWGSCLALGFGITGGLFALAMVVALIQGRGLAAASASMALQLVGLLGLLVFGALYQAPLIHVREILLGRWKPPVPPVTRLASSHDPGQDELPGAQREARTQPLDLNEADPRNTQARGGPVPSRRRR